MTDVLFAELHAEVVKDLGIFALQALITINAGAIIALISLTPLAVDSENLRIEIPKIKRAILFFLFGLAMSFVSILITYFTAQLSVVGIDVLSFGWHVFFMTFPPSLSFLFFCLGAHKASKSISEQVLS